MVKVSLTGQSSDSGLRDPFLGCILGQRYLVTQLLGTGAMGRVYLAHDRQLGNVKVAVKLLSQSLQDPKAQQRFEREAQTGAYLGQKSLHIVRVNDYGITPNGIPYSVMEYLPGLTLREMMEREGHFQTERAVRLGRQIALGLQAAHEGLEVEGRRIKVIHRDLKPANVMVVADPSLGELAKILDFGIAKLQDPQGLASITHAYVGTLAYSSPEQLEGLPLDGRADLYSFGVMLYHMIAGELPLLPATESYPAWYQAHHKGRPLPLEELVDVPLELSDLVMACLAKHPAERPQSAQQVVSYLQAIETQNTYGATGSQRSLGSQSLNPGSFPVLGNLLDRSQRGGTVRLADSPTELEPHPWGSRLMPLLLGSLLGLICITVGWTATRAFFNTPLVRPVSPRPTPLPLNPEADRQQTFAAAMRSGQEAFNAGDFEMALLQFDLALEAAPSSDQEQIASSWQQDVQQQLQAQQDDTEPDLVAPDLDQDPDEIPPLFSDMDLAQSPELLGQILNTLNQAGADLQNAQADDSGDTSEASTIALRTFPLRTGQATIRNALGQPQSSGMGYWPNTVYDLYNFESPLFEGRIDMGLIYDQDSRVLRQSEVTVTDGVPDEAARMLLSQLLQGNPPADVVTGLQGVRQGQSNRHSFQQGGLQGVIERNAQGNVYMAVWEPGLHQVATQAQPAPNTANPSSNDPAPGQTLQEIRERARERR